MGQSFKKLAQAGLKHIGLYERVKGSRLYDAYWKIADPSLIAARDAEVDLYRRVLKGLPANALIFDVGANQGYKTDMFLRLGARVIAVDPDKSNQNLLAQRFASLRLRKRPVVVVGKAVSDRNGTETMWIDEPGSAKNTLNRKWVETLRADRARFGETLDFGAKQEVQTITLEALIAQYGRPFYLKIDVEGYEATVLAGLKSKVPYISFEVNLPEFRAEGEECIRMLNAIAPDGLFNYVQAGEFDLAWPEWLEPADFAERWNTVGNTTVEVFWTTEKNR